METNFIPLVFFFGLAPGIRRNDLLTTIETSEIRMKYNGNLSTILSRTWNYICNSKIISFLAKLKI
jgi:hypothetical protein